MSHRVLVVEDDELLREAVDLILTQSGYTVTTVGNGRDAIDTLRRSLPDLVLLDIRLPGIDGLEVLRLIRKENNPVPVVMMTANSTAETVRDVMAAGGNGYILKPFEAVDLIRRVSLAFKRV